MKWNNLTMTERSQVMDIFLEHGIYDLDKIHSVYDDGGWLDEPDDPPTKDDWKQYLYDYIANKNAKNPDPILKDGELIPKDYTATPMPILNNGARKVKVPVVKVIADSPHSDYQKAHWNETEQMKQKVAARDSEATKQLLTAGTLVMASPAIAYAAVQGAPYAWKYAKQAWPYVKQGAKDYFSLNPNESLGASITRNVINESLGYATNEVSKRAFSEDLYKKLNENPTLSNWINYGSDGLEFVGKGLQVLAEVPGFERLEPAATVMNKLGALGSGVIGGMAVDDATTNGINFDNTMDMIGALPVSTFNTSSGNYDEWLSLGSTLLLGFGTDAAQDIYNANKGK